MLLQLTTMGEDDRRQTRPAVEDAGEHLIVAPSADEGDPVDVHKPKPFHSWREFFGEVGIIVIGVLIALAGEQAVEALHWRERVSAAEESMRKELAEDNGAQAMARLQFAPCLDRALAANQQRLLAERDRGIPFTAATLVPPPFRTWDNDAWRAAVSSEATSHMKIDVMYNWSSPYALIADMDQTAVREFNDWAPLMQIGSARSHPSEPERERLIAALGAARQDNALLTRLSQKLIDYSAIAGVTPSPESVRRQREQHRDAMAGCGS